MIQLAKIFAKLCRQILAKASSYSYLNDTCSRWTVGPLLGFFYVPLMFLQPSPPSATFRCGRGAAWANAFPR